LRFLVFILEAFMPCQVVLRNSAVLTQPENWPGQRAGLRGKLEAFHRVFRPRIKRLDAGDLAPEPTSSWESRQVCRSGLAL
jgi:hypothetical protein